jgi:hypothetical protein
MTTAKQATTKQAHVTPVSIGNLTIDGLMDEKGNFYVAVPQIADLIQTARNIASRDLKRLMGAGFETSKLKTQFNQNSTNAVSLDVFERVLVRLDRQGNKFAQDLRDDLVGLSLKQLFSDAFKVQFEAQDRQDYMCNRQTGKEVFKRLMMVVQARLHSQGKNDPGHYYAQLVNKIYRGLFGVEAKELRDMRSVPSSGLTRDHFTARELAVISRVEDGIMFMIQHMGKEPFEAVDLCIQSTGTYHTLAINPE